MEIAREHYEHVFSSYGGGNSHTEPPQVMKRRQFPIYGVETRTQLQSVLRPPRAEEPRLKSTKSWKSALRSSPEIEFQASNLSSIHLACQRAINVPTITAVASITTRM